MKKTITLVVCAVAFSLLVSACVQTTPSITDSSLSDSVPSVSTSITSPSVSTTTGPTTSVTPSISDTVTSNDPSTPEENWEESIKDKMNAELGELLPYIELVSPSVFIEPDYFLISEYNQPSKVSEYGEIALANGYVLKSENEGSYLYVKDSVSYSNKLIYLQVEYYLGDSQYDPGTDIYAWLDEKPDSEFPQDKINEYLSETGVIVPSMDGEEFYSSIEDGYYLLDVYSSETNLVEVYRNSLDNDTSNFWNVVDYDGTIFATNYEETVGITFYLVDDAYLSIQYFITLPSYTKITEDFPREDLIAVHGENTANLIPSFNDVEGLGYKVALDVNIVIQVNDAGTPGVDAIEDTYSQALNSAGWNIDTSQVNTVGYIAVHVEAPNLQLVYYTYGGAFLLTISDLSGEL